MPGEELLVLGASGMRPVATAGLADRLTGTLPPHGWGQTTTAAPGLSS